MRPWRGGPTNWPGTSPERRRAQRPGGNFHRQERPGLRRGPGYPQERVLLGALGENFPDRRLLFLLQSLEPVAVIVQDSTAQRMLALRQAHGLSFAIIQLDGAGRPGVIALKPWMP